MHNLREAQVVKNRGRIARKARSTGIELVVEIFRARFFSVSSSSVGLFLPSCSSSMPSGHSIIDRSAVISSVCRDRSKCLERYHSPMGRFSSSSSTPPPPLLPPPLPLLLRFAINAMDISLHRSPLATILSPQLNRREKSEARQKASGFYIPSL